MLSIEKSNELIRTENINEIKKAKEKGIFNTDKGTLDLAIETKNDVIIVSAIKAGAKPSRASLDLAIETGKLPTLYNVINAGAKPSRNSLDLAIKTENLIIVCSVIEAGAKPSNKSLGLANKTGCNSIILVVEGCINQKIPAKKTKRKHIKSDFSNQVISDNKEIDTSQTKTTHIRKIDPHNEKTLDDTEKSNNSDKEDVVDVVEKCIREMNVFYDESAKQSEAKRQELWEHYEEESDSAHYTALNSAIKTKAPKIVHSAIEKGAKPNYLSLKLAIKTENIDIVDLVVKAGAEPTYSSLNLAIKTESPKIVSSVIEAGAKPNCNSLDLAIKTKIPMIVSSVIEAGAKPSDKSLCLANKTECNSIILAVEGCIKQVKPAIKTKRKHIKSDFSSRVISDNKKTDTSHQECLEEFHSICQDTLKKRDAIAKEVLDYEKEASASLQQELDEANDFLKKHKAKYAKFMSSHPELGIGDVLIDLTKMKVQKIISRFNELIKQNDAKPDNAWHLWGMFASDTNRQIGDLKGEVISLAKEYATYRNRRFNALFMKYGELAPIIDYQRDGKSKKDTTTRTTINNILEINSIKSSGCAVW